MYSAVEIPPADRAGRKSWTPLPVAVSQSGFCQHVAPGAMVFQAGEQRRLYRVDSGAVCHFIRWADGRFEVIDFAFPGDIIGLGYLPTHVSTARAMVATEVSVVTKSDFEKALVIDDSLSFRLADAGEREFDVLRDRSIKASLLGPRQRLACFLLAMASINANEGREPIVGDDLSSGFVAERLNMSIDTLAMALLSLRRSGLLAVSDYGLRIVDPAALEFAASA